MTNPNTPTTVPSSHPLAIECVVHGTTRYCIICKHLLDGSGLGYFAIQPDPTEPAQAWCEGCDFIFQHERGWSDRADAEAEWKLACTGCYDTTLVGHHLRSWVQGSNPEDFE